MITGLILSIVMACPSSMMELKSGEAELKTGDLIFEIASDSAMSRAIAEATSGNDSIRFSHVGIIEVDGEGNVTVIEATGKYGVTTTPIDSFMDKAKEGTVVKRLTIDYPIDSAVERAKGYIGRGYDWWYLPDNEEIYCSELVEKSYLKEDGTAIFPTIPMNFRDREGNMPRYWIDLFNRLGRPIPEGLPGTNPSQLSRTPELKTVGIISKE